MHAYTAYRRWLGGSGRAETQVIRDGFVWGAFLFGPLWAVVRIRWIAAATLAAGWLVVGILAGLAGTSSPAVAFWLIAALWSGFSARDLEAWSLEKQGWTTAEVILAPSLVEAEARMIASDASRTKDVERRW
jgi:anti-sigma factor RsiW